MGANIVVQAGVPDAGVSSAMTLDEANQLAAACVGGAAHALGIRVIMVKGISLQAHRLRSTHTSSDTDLLATPGDVDALCTQLTSSGWQARSGSTGGSRMARHSVALTHPAWPNDVDVHFFIPGLLCDPSRAFEALWSHRERATVAGQPVWMPDRASSTVIWALHSLRGTATQARHADELRQIREVVLPSLSEAERHELADRIVELGADEPLRVVPEFAEIVGDRHGPQAPGALEAWNAKVAQAHEASPWLQVLRDARPGDRPWLLFRAVWPSAHDLRLMDEELVDTPIGRVQSRGRRAWRLVRRIVERRRQAH